MSSPVNSAIIDVVTEINYMQLLLNAFTCMYTSALKQIIHLNVSIVVKDT